MSKIRELGDGLIAFWCPGCDEFHTIRIAEAQNVVSTRPQWSYNHDENAPTFQPSVLVRTGHYIPGQVDKQCWCNYTERTGKEAPFKCHQCHSFVVDGRIQFLSDCSHRLAGQTVDLPDYPET